MAKPLHLISYILHNQPHSVEVESNREQITPEQARVYLSALHTFEWPNEFTDIQVTRIQHPKKRGTTPAHRVQR
ncbi:hypothetical protein OU800_12800 [Pseudomonas sp. GOM7]|uniref:hypothetical protein n=1 Tax=unclassified Pseudomonas TaxID=196821 RepID=UPI00227CCC4F|nr:MULTISPECIES: hypothetical protein [unclassified Pseudomonas]WAJ35520.1 hypothetical protein OU800_12800 [Pseudomonas sp. GOM7]